MARHIYSIKPLRGSKIRIPLIPPLVVGKTKGKTLSLSQCILPPHRSTYFVLPPGHLLLNDEIVLPTQSEFVYWNTNELVDFFNNLINTHNLKYRFYHQEEIDLAIRYRRLIGPAQVIRSQLIDSTISPTNLDNPVARKEWWETLCKSGAASSYLQDIIEHEEFVYKTNASIFHPLRYRNEGVIFDLRPTQKISFCDAWKSSLKMIARAEDPPISVESHEIARTDRRLNRYLISREVDLISLQPDSSGERNDGTHIVCSGVKNSTTVNTSLSNLLDILPPHENVRLGLKKRSLEKVQLRAGVHNHLDLSFLTPGEIPIRFTNNSVFLKLVIEDEDDEWRD